jgi:hypothetical protein
MVEYYTDLVGRTLDIINSGKKIFFSGLLLLGLSYAVPHESYEHKEFDYSKPVFQRISEQDYSTLISKGLFVAGVSTVLLSSWKTKDKLLELVEEEDVDIRLNDLDVRDIR